MFSFITKHVALAALVSVFFAMNASAADKDLDYYADLLKVCGKKTSQNCCISSLKQMRHGGYRLKEGKSCPEGMTSNTLKCKDSFTWCEPSRDLSGINPIDYEAMKAYCEKANPGPCCLASVRTMKEQSYTLAPKNKKCPEGRIYNAMECPGSLGWCEPD